MGPFIKSNTNVKKMIMHTINALIPIIIFSFIKNGIIPYTKGYTNLTGLFYPIIFILIPTISVIIYEILYNIIFQKQTNISNIKNNYNIITGILIGLMLPINTPIILLVLAPLISIIINKLIQKIFKNTIINPALIGTLLVLVIYPIIMGNISYLNKYEIATSPEPNYINTTGTYETMVKPYGGLLNFFIGTIPGTIGETSVFLCIISFIYLTYFKVIKWKIPITYILTVFAITYVIGGTNIWYPILQILSCGLIFKAIFITTDPKTSPLTPIGQILYGLFLGILTIIFKYIIPLEQGIIISILIMNLLVKTLDKIGSLARFDFKKSLIPFIIAWIMILGLSIGIPLKYNQETPTINETTT